MARITGRADNRDRDLNWALVSTFPALVARTPRQAAVRGKALELVTQVLLVTLVPRLLGPEDFGRLTLALAIVTAGAVAIALGAPSAFVRFVPEETGARRAGLARSMTAALVPVRAIQLTLVALIGATLVFVGPRFSATDVGLVFIALAAEVAATLAAQVALGIGETWIWSFRVSARNIGLLLLVPFLAPLGPAGVLSSVALGALAGFVFAAGTAATLVRHAEPNVPIPAGAMRFGRVAGLGILVGQLTYRGPVMAASVLGLSADEVGYAGLAASIAMAIILAVRELFTVSLPELVETWSRDQSDADRRLRQLGQRAQWALAAAAIVGVIAMDRLLPLVVGERFAPASAAMIPILAMMPLLPLPAICGPSSSLRLQPALPFRIDGVGLIALVVAAIVLVPRWGAVGATSALMVAVVVSSVLTTWALPTVATARLLTIGLITSGSVFAIAAALRNFW